MFAVYFYSPDNIDSRWPTVVSFHTTATGADKARDKWRTEGLDCDVVTDPALKRRGLGS